MKIGISSTLTKNFLLPYLREFHRLHPKIDIQIDTAISAELLHKLKNGLIDIVIFHVRDVDYGKDIELTKCREIRDCFVVNDSYKDLLNREVSLTELNNYPLLLQDQHSNARRFLDEYTKKYGVSLKPNIELASYALVVEFAKIGLGIGYVTKDYITKEIENKELYPINIKEKIPARHIGIAISRTHLPNFSAKKLMEMILKDK